MSRRDFGNELRALADSLQRDAQAGIIMDRRRFVEEFTEITHAMLLSAETREFSAEEMARMEEEKRKRGLWEELKEIFSPIDLPSDADTATRNDGDDEDDNNNNNK